MDLGNGSICYCVRYCRPVLKEDLMLDVGYGILIASAIHGALTGFQIATAVTLAAIGGSSLWAATQSHRKGLGAYGVTFLSVAALLVYPLFQEPTRFASLAFEETITRFVWFPLHVLVILLLAFLAELALQTWHRSKKTAS